MLTPGAAQEGQQLHKAVGEQLLGSCYMAGPEEAR
jgi:hypothetical protein